MKNRVFEAALEIQRFCQEQGYRFCVIGGVALQRWGENRNTNDADLTVITGFGDEDRFIDAFLELFLIRQGEKLDKAQIVKELKPLVELKEEPGILDRLTVMLK